MIGFLGERETASLDKIENYTIIYKVSFTDEEKMKKLSFSVIFLVSIALSACASKKTPNLVPELPDIAGEYDFLLAAFGAGHGGALVPDVLPFGPDGLMMLVKPSGTFTFNADATFKLSFKLVGQSVLDLAPSGRNEDLETEILAFEQITGAYNFAPNNKIIFKTQSGTSVYSYGFNGYHLSLMPFSGNVKDYLVVPYKGHNEESKTGAILFNLYLVSSTK